MTTRIGITEEQVRAYERELGAELPRFAVRYKDESTLQRVIARLLWPFNRTYLTGYTTVMFGRVYFPSRTWRERAGPAVVYKILRHEAVHLRDARRFPLIFQLSYLFALPTILTVRAVWEWRAYKETLRVELELEGRVTDALIEDIVRRFVGPDYLFMCPFPGLIRRRLRAALAELGAGDCAGTPEAPSSERRRNS